MSDTLRRDRLLRVISDLKRAEASLCYWPDLNELRGELRELCLLVELQIKAEREKESREKQAGTFSVNHQVDEVR